MKGNLYVISGPSGVGKDTLVAYLFDNIPSLKSSVSVTTRPPRPGEKHGREYFFYNRGHVEKLIADNKLLEWNEYAGNIYGTPRDFIETHVNNGDDVLLSIDVNGAINIKKNYKDSRLIFILPPSIDELKNRLTNRGTESASTIKNRLAIAKEEMDNKHIFDKCIVNDRLDDACLELCRYIESNMQAKRC